MVLTYGDIILVGGGNEIYSSRKIQRRLKKILDENFNVGLDTKDTVNRIVAHSLRHSAISLLIIAGMPIASVSRLVGHSSIDITMSYSHLSPDAGESYVNSMLGADTNIH